MHMNLILCLLALLKVSLFSLLNDIAASIRDSYQGGSLWEKQTQDKSHRRLSPIGETWWWVKHENGLFMQYSHCTAIRAKARGFKEGLRKYVTVNSPDFPESVSTNHYTVQVSRVKRDGHPLCPLYGDCHTREPQKHCQRFYSCEDSSRHICEMGKLKN